jgi:uncharacterized membrane protein
VGILATFAVLSLILHRVVSGSRLRDRFVAKLGEEPFRRGFAAASLLCLIGLWIGYRQAAGSPSDVALLASSDFAKAAQFPIQLVAFLFIIAGVSTRNPTIAGLGTAVRDPGVVRGILRITRHPFLWGVSLFSIGHMLASPTLASLGFFGTLLFLAVTGTISIDAKRRRALGADWQAFVEATSNVPFAAIVSRRQPLALGEIGWKRVIAAIGLVGLLVAAHGALFGADAWP